MGLFTQLEIGMTLMSGDNIAPLYPVIVPAFDAASKNLRERYNVHIIRNFPFLSSDPRKQKDAVLFTMFVPEELMQNGFNVGRHMLGVTRYIRTHHNELYGEYMNGQGLFTYEVYKTIPGIEIID